MTNYKMSKIAVQPNVQFRKGVNPLAANQFLIEQACKIWGSWAWKGKVWFANSGWRLSITLHGRKQKFCQGDPWQIPVRNMKERTQQWNLLVKPCHNLAWKETKFLALQSNPDNGITLQARKKGAEQLLCRMYVVFFLGTCVVFFLWMYVGATGVKLW